MKFLSEINRDYLVVGASLIIISVCSVMLYADFTRKMEAGGATQIGTITYKHKVTQRKYASQVVWEDVEQNTPVYNNDSIRTAELSEAIVNLSDGTRINIDENSLIMLAFAGKGINIDFSHGTISANREDNKEREPASISIQSKEGTVSLDTGDVKLTKTRGKELDVTVTEGKAEIKTEKAEKTIRKDEKAVVTKDAGAAIVALKLKLKSPSHNDTFTIVAPVKPVDFTWEPVEGGTAVYLDLARSADFTVGTVTRTVAKNSYTENLGEGSYYWRIRALNKISNVQESSDVRKINIIRDQPVVLMSPENNETISYRLKPPIISFRWERNRLASDYILEISRDAAFKTRAVSLATPLIDLSIDWLQAGTYYWRVKTKNSGIPSYGGLSTVYRFQINRIAAVNPPVLILPPDGKRVGASMLEKGKGFMFSWTSDSQVRKYDLMIARDTGFNDVAMRVRTGGNFHALRQSLKPGRYYWRVGIVPEESEKEAFSAPNSLLIIPAATVTLGDPRVESVTVEGPGERRAAIRFAWKVDDFNGTSRLELSRDRAFLNIFSATATMENYSVIGGIPAGAYYWRVRLIDDDRSQIAESDGRSLYVSTAGAIAASAEEIVPKNAPVDMAGREFEDRKKEEEAIRKEREDIAKKEEALAKEKERERARLREEERSRMQKEELAKKKEEEILQKKQEALARKKEEELAKQNKTEAERKEKEDLARKQQEELARKKREELDRKKAGELARKKQEELSRKQQEESARKKMEEDLARRNEMESARKQQEERARRIEEESARKKREELAENEKRDKIRLIEYNKYKEKHPGRRLRWRSDLASTIMSRPVCRNNIIIATTKNGFLVGLNMNGGKLWRTALGSAARSTPAADDRAAYVVTVEGTLYSIDLRSGAINWKKSVEGPLLFGSEPAVYGDLIFVATSYGMVQAFSSKGTEVWRRNLEEGIFSSITVNDAMLYVGTDRAKIYCLNAHDGRVKWTFNTDARIFISSPRVYRGILFVGCYSGTFFAVDARSGWLRWRFKANKPVLSTPAFHEQVVYFGSEDGTVYALEISDGRKLWDFYTKRPIIAGADVFGENLLIPSGSTLYSIDAVSGDLNWKESLAAGINTPVTVVGNAAYVGLDNGEVVSVSSF